MGIFAQAIVENNEILEYIPQRPPIVMIDEFFGVEDNRSVTALTIKEDNILCENGELCECGVIEHIAQSAAMRVGYFYKNAGKTVPIGFIGAVNKFTIYMQPKVADKITTEIKVEQELINITLISAIVRCNCEIVAECTMKIFLQE